MEPNESPGEPKPCREEISALLRENSVKTKTAKRSENLFWLQHHVPLRKERETTVCSAVKALVISLRGGGGRLTSWVVGGGHAGVEQALWGQARGGDRHHRSGQWLGAAYPLGVLQITKKP